MKIDSSLHVLVTGANGGIGAAIARAFAARGARLTLSGRRAEALAPLASELGARVVVADLADPVQVERLVREAGEVDVAVLNAAHPASGLLDEYGPEAIDEIVRVNLTSPILTARALAPGMKARGKGQLVFITSVAGLVANPGSSLYNATKFGLRGFALALRLDLAESNVGVTNVSPGFIRDAGMFAASGVQLPPGIGTRSPEDVAVAVVRAVETNPADVVVAAVDQRLGAFVGAMFPRLAGAITGAGPARDLARRISAGQRRNVAARSSKT